MITNRDDWPFPFRLNRHDDDIGQSKDKEAPNEGLVIDPFGILSFFRLKPL
jgi:hypothetical protein